MNATSPAIEIVPVETHPECVELARALADVWGFVETSGVASPDSLAAMAHSGCYLVGVRDGGRMIGGGYGWPTRVGDEWRVHSHVVGFLDSYRALGLGARVKHHQRDWAKANGYAAVEWTYDPLHIANARFNLGKLGARVQSFHRDFYGFLDDEFSAGLGSDRFLVRWGIDDEPPVVDTARWAPLVSVADDGSPTVTPSDAMHVSVALPANIVALRKQDRGRALQWRDAFATHVGGAVADGATVVGITAGGAYLINR